MSHRIKNWRYLKKQSKYKNSPRDYAGNQYHSIKEAKYARDLDLRKRAGEIVSWERQVRQELYAYEKHICNYFIDFVINHNDGSKEFVEVKGFATDVWRLKWKLFEAQMGKTNPCDVLTIVK